MGLQLSTAVRDACNDLIESTIGTAPLLKIYSGAVAANCAAAAPSGLLATLTLPSDWLTGSSSGAKAKNGTWSGTASGGSGATPQSFRVYDSGDSVCHMQGTVTIGAGGDMVLDGTITSGQTITFSAFDLTELNS